MKEGRILLINGKETEIMMATLLQLFLAKLSGKTTKRRLENKKQLQPKVTSINSLLAEEELLQALLASRIQR